MFSHNKNLITIKDTTNTGGKVLTASSSIFIDNLPVVCVSDKVKCGIIEHGISSVLTGSTSFFSNGKVVAVDGSKLSCGCYLIKQEALFNFQNQKKDIFKGQFQWINHQNQPLKNIPYIAFVDNFKIKGKLNERGLSQVFQFQEPKVVYLHLDFNYQFQNSTTLQALEEKGQIVELELKNE